MSLFVEAKVKAPLPWIRRGIWEIRKDHRVIHSRGNVEIGLAENFFGRIFRKLEGQFPIFGRHIALESKLLIGSFSESSMKSFNESDMIIFMINRWYYVDFKSCI